MSAAGMVAAAAAAASTSSPSSNNNGNGHNNNNVSSSDTDDGSNDFIVGDLSQTIAGLQQTKQLMNNNVLWRRKKQLTDWETSEMAREPLARRHAPRVKFQDSDVFLSACIAADFDEVQELLDGGADLNTATVDGLTALHQAVIDSKPDMVAFLVERGADVNAQDNEGWTPLHAAACCGNLDIVRYLCGAAPADLTVVNSDRELPIDLAEDDQCRTWLDEEYRRRSIDVDACRGAEESRMLRDVRDWHRSGRSLDAAQPRTLATALHVAAAKGYVTVVRELLSLGASPNSRDRDGWTPLHAAAHWAEKDACRLLINAGARLDELTDAGQTVLAVADKDAVEFLQQFQEETKEKAAEKRLLQPAESVEEEDEEDEDEEDEDEEEEDEEEEEEEKAEQKISKLAVPEKVVEPQSTPSLARKRPPVFQSSTLAAATRRESDASPLTSPTTTTTVVQLPIPVPVPVRTTQQLVMTRAGSGDSTASSTSHASLTVPHGHSSSGNGSNGATNVAVTLRPPWLTRTASVTASSSSAGSSSASLASSGSGSGSSGSAASNAASSNGSSSVVAQGSSSQPLAKSVSGTIAAAAAATSNVPGGSTTLVQKPPIPASAIFRPPVGSISSASTAASSHPAEGSSSSRLSAASAAGESPVPPRKFSSIRAFATSAMQQRQQQQQQQQQPEDQTNLQSQKPLTARSHTAPAHLPWTVSRLEQRAEYSSFMLLHQRTPQQASQPSPQQHHHSMVIGSGSAGSAFRSPPLRLLPGARRVSADTIHANRPWGVSGAGATTPTPPAAPVHAESEAERKQNSRVQRASRRSTQAVTQAQLNEATSIMSGSATGSRTSSRASPTRHSREASLSNGENELSAETATPTPPPSASSSAIPHHPSALPPRFFATEAIATTKTTGQELASTTTSPASVANLRRKTQSGGPLLPRRGTGPVVASALEELQNSLSSATKGHGGSNGAPPVAEKQPPIVSPVPPWPRSNSLATSSGTESSSTASGSASSSDNFPRAAPRNRTVAALMQQSTSVTGTPPPSSSSLSTPFVASARVMGQPNLPRTTSVLSSSSSSSLGPPAQLIATDSQSNYKQLYERERTENEQLRRQIADMQLRGASQPPMPILNGHNSAHHSQPGASGLLRDSTSMPRRFVSSSASNPGPASGVERSASSASAVSMLTDEQRRFYERRIAEMEHEIKNLQQLRVENQRLKDENGALVRVISKISL